MANFSAIVKMDVEKTVVVTTLETLEELLKTLKSLSPPVTEETLDGLVVAVQDVLENKVLATQCYIT